MCFFFMGWESYTPYNERYLAPGVMWAVEGLECYGIKAWHSIMTRTEKFGGADGFGRSGSVFRVDDTKNRPVFGLLRLLLMSTLCINK